MILLEKGIGNFEDFHSLSLHYPSQINKISKIDLFGHWCQTNLF